MKRKTQKFYTVWVGRRRGVFNTWQECHQQTHKFEGALFKSFHSKEEANVAFNSESSEYMGQIIDQGKEEQQLELFGDSNTAKVTEITVAYRPAVPVGERIAISRKEDAIDIFLEAFNPDLIGMQEEFMVLYLNQGNRVLGLYKASKGGITGTVADTRIILSVGLKLLALKIVLAHNHPSGNLNPSRADMDLTNKIKQAAALMDIHLLDHLILAPSGQCYSFADEGLL